MKKLKKSIPLILMLIYILTGTMVIANSDTTVINVETANELVNVLTDTTKLPVVYKKLTINIKNDIDVSGVTWTPGYVNGYDGAEVYTVNGNGHTITGLKNSLFSSVWSGKANLIINDLTIANSNISGGTDAGGFGAFIAEIDAIEQVTLNNCHLKNSSVTGTNWTGGLIGYASGNEGALGKIFIKNSSVQGCTITGANSTGAVLGHATADPRTYVNIQNVTVRDNTIICTDDSNIKAGDVMGTVGIGEVTVNAIVSNNIVTSNGTPINRIFGRFGSGGVLKIDGGKYDWNDLTLPDNGELIITGGEFAGDPTNFVAQGCEVMKKGETYVVCEHKWITHEAVEPTCTEQGNVQYYVCEKCGAMQAELNGERVSIEDISETKIDIIPHKLTLVPEKKPTYTTEGNKAYWMCECGKIFEDSEGKNEIVDKNSIIISKLVQVEGNKAEVGQEAVEEAIKESITTNTDIVVLPLKENFENVNSVVLETESINNIINADKALTVETAKATVTFDKKALEAIAKESSNTNNITLKVVNIEKSDLNDEQNEALKDKKVSMIISAEILCGDKYISSFGKGKVTVKIPFSLEENTKESDYKLIYIYDDGKIEEIETKYIDGHIVAVLRHFSEYAIVKVDRNYTENEDTEDKDYINNNNENEDTENNDDENINTGNNNSKGNPKTGDNIYIYVIILSISILGILVINKDKKNKKTSKH